MLFVENNSRIYIVFYSSGRTVPRLHLTMVEVSRHLNWPGGTGIGCQWGKGPGRARPGPPPPPEATPVGLCRTPHALSRA